MDNFRRPKRTYKHTSIDGIIPRGNTKRQGSIDFQRGAHHGHPRTVVKRLDDFKRPEGFTSVTQPIVSVDRPLADWQSGPRRRSQLELGEELTAKKKNWFRRHKQKRHDRPKSWKRRILKSAAALSVLVLLLGGFLGWKFVHNTSKIFKGSIFSIFDTTKLKGEDTGRVNILLTGNSVDDPNHDGAALTDSIMIISIDTVHNTAFLLSVPRDLWVNYGTNNCQFGNRGKINAVLECGDSVNFHQNGYPNGGIGLLEKNIQNHFGITLNYYVKIDYTAFRDAVNAVGGVDVKIKTNDPRGLYDGNIGRNDGGPLKLSNGQHHLNGQTALNLARARCDTVCYGFTNGDFDRTEHQRQILLSLKDKALSLGVLGNPAKISSLLDAIGNNVSTDFKTSEIRRLYDLTKQIQNKNIQSLGLSDPSINLVTTGMMDGQSIVRPKAGVTDFSDIQAFMKRLTSNDPVVKEGATVAVLNGSSVSGSAQTQANLLKQKGITVSAVANANKQRTATIIVMLDNTKPLTKTYLEQKYKTTVTTDTTANPEAQNYQVDFVIILGSQ